MYKLTDYVVQVDITGLDPIPNSLGHRAGSVLVTYNNGPQSRFALKANSAPRKHYEVAVLYTARGQVLNAIETVQRFKDGEPEWLQAAKEANKAPRYTHYL